MSALLGRASAIGSPTITKAIAAMATAAPIPPSLPCVRSHA